MRLWMASLAMVALFAWPDAPPRAGMSQSPGAAATTPVCDDTLTPQRGPLGYRFRGDRCEGGPADGGAGIDAAGVTDAAGSAGSGFGAATVLGGTVAANARPRGSHHVQTPVYYRMNTIAAGGGYRWPTDVLRAIGVTDVQLGVIATVEEVVNGTSQPVYLPVDLQSASSAPQPGRYLLKVASVEDLQTVFLTIIGPMKGGQAGTRRVSDQRIAGPYHSSATPMRIPLDLSAFDAGLYQIRLSATLSNRAGGTTLSFYLRHAR